MEESRKQVARKPPAKRVFHPIIGKRGDYQIDIMFLKYSDSVQYKRINDNNTCILLMVEVPTRYAYCTPMKSKEKHNVIDAFNESVNTIHEDQQEIKRITSDDGREFNNKEWDSMIAESGIQQFVKEPGDRYSLGIVDRLCRTLKEWIEEWQILNENLSWVDALPEILERYNAHQIRTLKASPARLRMNQELLDETRYNIEDQYEKAIEKFREFKIGDLVRVRYKPSDKPGAKASDYVAKGTDRWSYKVFRITGTDKLSFALTDSDGNEQKRMYRHHELMKVPEGSLDVPDIFKNVSAQARIARKRI